jgi:rubrerythrin
MKMKMIEKELEDDLKIFQNRVSHLETLIDGLQTVRVGNANCHFNMDTDKLRKAKDLLMEYSKKELERLDEQIRLIKSDLEQHHYICSECNMKISDRERPEKCFNCQSKVIIPDVIHFPKEWNYSNINDQTKES